VAFIICNPALFYPEYRIEVNPKELEELKIADVKSVETYAIITVPVNPKQMSINLQGPILINTETRLAKQLVLVNSNYKVKHLIFDMLSAVETPAEKQEQEEPTLTV
jgi:flagellar assembly factor FliW